MQARASRVAEWIGLAAAPTFAVLAVVTVLRGDQGPDMLCASGHGTSPLGGMAMMYLLMGAFHLAPWLKRLSRRESCP